MAIVSSFLRYLAGMDHRHHIVFGSIIRAYLVLESHDMQAVCPCFVMQITWIWNSM